MRDVRELTFWADRRVFGQDGVFRQSRDWVSFSLYLHGKPYGQLVMLGGIWGETGYRVPIRVVVGGPPSEATMRLAEHVRERIQRGGWNVVMETPGPVPPRPPLRRSKINTNL